MTALADLGVDAGSNIVRGNGTSSLTFDIPNTPSVVVQSVVATVNNTAGGATTATLTVRDQSGQVIARKRQSETIDAGASGTATFALRLDDDGTGTGVVLQSASYSGSRVNIASGALGLIPWDSFDAGADLLNISTPTAPTVRTAGLYIVTSEVSCDTGGISFRQSFFFGSAGPGSAGVGMTGDLSGLGATGFVTLTIAAVLAQGDSLGVQVLNQGGIAANFNEVQGSVSRIA